ncbi:MAG: prolyl oligopeptidase family serine peptidase [Chloroflexota bacterium]|nr:prolyl oligopeptidase family serine peptidase [Chloroflexota bacterium]
MTRRALYGILLNRWLLLFGLLVSLLLIWLSSSDNSRVWSVRNTLEYRFLQQWWQVVGVPQQGAPGSISGVVLDVEGHPLPNAAVLAARWDGTTYHARSGVDGGYVVEGIPAGIYRPVAGAPGYESQVLGELWGAVQVDSGMDTTVNVALAPEPEREIRPASELVLDTPSTRHCESPLASSAIRRAITFWSDGRPNQTTFLYRPVEAPIDSELATLLAVYPGPTETWECTSVPLAAAGYAVLAVGPAYSLDLERDVDELEQLLNLTRARAFPGIDGERIAVLGGSYSALLTQRLLQRDEAIDAAVLLGPPTDLFDIRRRFEAGTFIPPFGLDRVLVALGLPDRDPMPYWRYSSIYHLHPNMPPTAIFHSYQDEIVPYQQSVQLANVLDELGVEHELYLFDGATHYLLEASEQALEIYDLTLAFLAQHLR